MIALPYQPRKYERIWIQIRDNCDPDKWITVTVKNREMIQTIINMVTREKSRVNVTRKKLDLPAYGILAIRRDYENLQVSFQLQNAGAQL